VPTDYESTPRYDLVAMHVVPGHYSTSERSALKLRLQFRCRDASHIRPGRRCQVNVAHNFSIA
jgi:hypothetical protein